MSQEQSFGLSGGDSKMKGEIKKVIEEVIGVCDSIRGTEEIKERISEFKTNVDITSVENNLNNLRKIISDFQTFVNTLSDSEDKKRVEKMEIPEWIDTLDRMGDD